MKFNDFVKFVKRHPKTSALVLAVWLLIGLIASAIENAPKPPSAAVPIPTATPAAIDAIAARGYCWAYLKEQPLTNLEIGKDVVAATLHNNQGVMEWRYLGGASYVGANGLVGRVYRCHLDQYGGLLLLEWVQ